MGLINKKVGAVCLLLAVILGSASSLAFADEQPTLNEFDLCELPETVKRAISRNNFFREDCKGVRLLFLNESNHLSFDIDTQEDLSDISKHLHLFPKLKSVSFRFQNLSHFSTEMISFLSRTSVRFVELQFDDDVVFENGAETTLPSVDRLLIHFSGQVTVRANAIDAFKNLATFAFLGNEVSRLRKAKIEIDDFAFAEMKNLVEIEFIGVFNLGKTNRAAFQGSFRVLGLPANFAQPDVEGGTWD